MSDTSTAAAELTIAVLLPETLGTYSDSGNAQVLLRRAQWRDIDAEVVAVPLGGLVPRICDIYVLGGGEDSAQVAAARWLATQPAVRAAIDGPAVTLGVCAGFQLLGHTMTDRAGRTYPGLGLLDMTTAPRPRRAVGEVVSACGIPGVGRLTGFENHRGGTQLGPHLQPLGRVEEGVGNGHGTDGAVAGRVLGTYLHGPVLARNPALADHILALATGRTLDPIELPDQLAVRQTYLGETGRRARTRSGFRPRRVRSR